MSRYIRMSLLIVTVATALPMPATHSAEPGIRDLTFFLRRLRTLEHLPELEPSHTAMSSTWDRSGGNLDGWDFKHVEDGQNVLLDVNGPGCIHRMFTGWLGRDKDMLGRPGPAGTRLQIFLDHAEQPVLDLPVERFFDDRDGPFPYPLVFHKTYPGILFPIPFARHCRVQLVSPESPNWGNFWQITYTTYPPATRVKSLTWPLSDAEAEELGRVRETWLEAESRPPAAPAQWTVDRELNIGPGEVNEVRIGGVFRGEGVPPLRPAGILPAVKEQGQDALATQGQDALATQGQDALATGCGVIRQMRVGVWPPTPELLRGIRLQIRWDGAEEPSVDVPLGYFFGNADYAYANDIHFNSLLLGVTPSEAYCCFPMPFSRGAVLRFENRSEQRAHRIRLALDIERRETLPDDWGRFHATWTEARAALPDAPRFGPKDIPCHMVLDRTGPGKYVGVLLHVQWPHRDWWGEGDWLIWTDEEGWPPSYHGTGSEEYFNSGWCSFDRKAVSGFIKTHPGEVALYSFHLNDAFQFQRSIRVAEETFGMDGAGMIGNTIIQRDHPVWGSTAYWYGPETPRTASPETPLGVATSETPKGRQFILVNRTRGPGGRHGLPAAIVREDFEAVRRALPDVPGARIRIGVGYIFSYFRAGDDALLLDSLRHVLELADQTDTPVLVQIDGEQWWEGRPDLWNWWDPSRPGFNPANRENVEWSGWTPEHALKIAWRNWGRQLRVLPPPNLMSPRYREACHEKMALMIPVVLDWWKALPAERKDLLVGVKVGWESSIGVNAWYYPNGNALLDEPADKDPASGLKGDAPPARGVAPIGYAAVKTAGIREAGELTESDLAEVAGRHLEDLSRQAARLGAPRDRLFTHGAGWKDGELLYRAALNPFSCPGWSFYRHAADPHKDIGVQEALKCTDAPWWAATEWFYPGPKEVEPWRQALDNTLVDRRCRYLCIYNWEGIRGSEPVLEAIRQAVAASANRQQ